MKLFLTFVCLLIAGFAHSQTPSTVVPLFPVNSANGELLYESPELILKADAQEAVYYPELVQFKNWKLAASIKVLHSDPALSRIQCVMEYTGEVSLNAAQLYACKPVVLLMPAQGVTYVPTTPKPPWGVDAPIRRDGSDGPKNLVIILIDTLRDDCAPPYGHPFVLAPHLDMLASMGTMFSNAYSSSSSTRPSIGTLFSGLHPVVHGADRHALNGARLRPGFPTIAEFFSEKGFETAGAVSNAQVTAAYGFERGFDRYHCPIRDHEVTTVGMQELQRLNEPFLLYLHYIAPHQPYEPAGLYKALYSGRAPYAEMDAYLEEITQDDRRVGRILAELARQGLLDRTVIWALSDHGEEFWEHGWNGHGAKVYEETVRTVSVVTNPAALPIGKKVDVPVMHADIFPTLIDLWGDAVDIPFAGLSLKPFLQDETSNIPSEFTRRSVFLHHGGGTKAVAHPSDKEAILFENEKWIWWTQTNEWEHYNLIDGPGERNNLVKSASDTISNMQDALLRFWQTQHHLAERLSTPGGDGKVNLSRQEMENLRDLGYVK